MNRRDLVDLQGIKQYSLPFPHFLSGSALRQDAADALLKWFEGSAPWSLVETDFYEQFEFSITPEQPPNDCLFLTDPKFTQGLNDTVARAFGVELDDATDVTAHHLTDQQSIRTHNDILEGAETHRLVIHVNAGWRDNNGGFFIFFNSADPADICKLVKPLHNSAVAFEISTRSSHAVSMVRNHSRYSVVFSFTQRR